MKFRSVAATGAALGRKIIYPALALFIAWIPVLHSRMLFGHDGQPVQRPRHEAGFHLFVVLYSPQDMKHSSHLLR